MEEVKYAVIMDGSPCAKDLTMEMALIFVKGIFERWYADENLSATIVRMEYLNNGKNEE